MNSLSKYLVKTFHHRRLGDSTGAIAGFASGLSVVVGLIAAHYAPRGFSKVSVALHLAKKPLIVKLAPAIAVVAVVFATVSGIVRFYTWCKKDVGDKAQEAKQA
jgi:hypothetical protein